MDIITFAHTSRILAIARNTLEHMVNAKGARMPVWDPPLMLEDKTGGCLCIADLNGTVHLKSFIGQVPRVKMAGYWELSEEKARRLSNHQMLSRHVSSWQSRNGQYDRWGGAIKASKYILSFSGLPEMYDEMFMVLVGIGGSYLTSRQAQEIADISSNPHWAQLSKMYGALAPS